MPINYISDDCVKKIQALINKKGGVICVHI